MKNKNAVKKLLISTMLLSFSAFTFAQVTGVIGATDVQKSGIGGPSVTFTDDIGFTNNTLITQHQLDKIVRGEAPSIGTDNGFIWPPQGIDKEFILSHSGIYYIDIDCSLGVPNSCEDEGPSNEIRPLKSNEFAYLFINRSPVTLKVSKNDGNEFFISSNEAVRIRPEEVAKQYFITDFENTDGYEKAALINWYGLLGDIPNQTIAAVNSGNGYQYLSITHEKIDTTDDIEIVELSTDKNGLLQYAVSPITEYVAQESICQDVEQFAPTIQYQPGEQVVYEGKLYEATRWTDISITPDTPYSGWELVGDCE
ncbi:hypothetical protein V9N52_004242 [Vibrio navarrensis]